MYALRRISVWEHYTHKHAQIEEVKSYFDEIGPEDLTVNDDMGTNIEMLFNFKPHATKNDMLDALPSRDIVDKLVFLVFNSTSSTQCESTQFHS